MFSLYQQELVMIQNLYDRYGNVSLKTILDNQCKYSFDNITLCMDGMIDTSPTACCLIHHDGDIKDLGTEVIQEPILLSSQQIHKMVDFIFGDRLT